MARGSGKKDDLVKCEYCGEFYSTTYKHCPFCNEDGTGGWDEPDEEEYEEQPRRPAGGKRLAGGAPAGGSRGERDRGPAPRINPMSVVGIVLSLILIVAAVCIIVSIFRSIVGGGKPKPTPTPAPPSIESVEPAPTPHPSAPVESELPSVEPTTPSVPVVEPTSFTLNRDDMSFFNPGEMYDLKVRLVPSDAIAEVTWKSSNPDVASVSWNGRVTAISKGTVTITATIEGVGEQSCIVRCQFEGSASSSSGSSGSNQSSSGGLTLSRDDFTLSSVGDSWTLVVSGTDSPVTWSSSNTDVATVSDGGKVVAVSKGTCTVTAEVDGVKLKCIVRCSW